MVQLQDVRKDGGDITLIKFENRKKKKIIMQRNKAGLMANIPKEKPLMAIYLLYELCYNEPIVG